MTKMPVLQGKKLKMYKALQKELGVVSAAVKQSGYSRQSHYKWLKTDSNYAEWVKSIQDECLDFSENALLKLIKAGHPQSVMFHLKTKGKSRGYVEKQEIEHSGGLSNVTINITRAKPKGKDGL